jgi:hypothetical protein
MANCKECKEKRMEVNTTENVPYIVHETAMARNERNVKRLVVALVVAIVLAFATNVGWLIYESQYETVDYSYAQDGEGTNIIGDGNDVDNGAEAQS